MGSYRARFIRTELEPPQEIMSFSLPQQAHFGGACNDPMTTNSALKLKLVALLLGMHFATPALAIGLGDLNVQSTLGQPLHATVEVLSAPATLDAECLSLHSSDNGIPAPSQTRFRIERRGDNALLHITTQRAINDPIAQFVLTSDCEGRLQREYVLLLDPPTQIETVGLHPPQATPESGAVGMSSTVVSTSSESAVSSTPIKLRASGTKPRRNASPKLRAQTVTSASTKPPATTAPHASLAQSDRAAPTPTKTEMATPRLVISGKRNLAQSGSLPAGLERNSASPDQSSPHSTSLSPTDLSDENTALNHRLAHLESQLAALSKRNAELETQFSSPLLATALAQPAVAQASPWPLYLIGGGLFTLSGVLFAGSRRRRDRPSIDASGIPSWARPIDAKQVKAHAGIKSPLPHADDMLQNDSLPPTTWRATPDDQDFAALPLTALAERTEVKEDILNQAEVYVAHGYPNLAINLLQEHLSEDPTGSPVPWLLLLDLLRRQGDEAGYTKASTACRRHFNVNFSIHPVLLGQEDSHGLENYPHTLDMLAQAWDTPEINDIFRDLIYDQRDGVRMGFAPDAYRDILLLRSIVQQKSQQNMV